MGTVFCFAQFMIRIGDHNNLRVVRSTSVGVFLGDNDGTEILLPNKYVPEGIQLNQELRVFCYLDHEERPIATTLEPLIKRDGFAFLEVAEVNNIGAFMDWGLEKQLLVPFKEQNKKLEKGKKYIVHCFLDEKSFRLVASTKVDRFLKNRQGDFEVNAQVGLLVNRKTDLGWEVIVEDGVKGLLFFSDVFRPLAVGDRFQGFIKKVREDGKLDVSLEPTGVQMLDATADKIYNRLVAEGGFLPLHDKSSPEEIRDMLYLSKKSFKKGIGILYKQRKIELLPNGIRLKK